MRRLATSELLPEQCASHWSSTSRVRSARSTTPNSLAWRRYESDPAIVFRLALDQARYDVTSAGRALMEKYWLGRRRKAPSTQLRIAVHVRRGDVAAMREAGHEQWVKRWLDLSCFEAVLSSIDAVVGPRARQVVLVSEGDPPTSRPLCARSAPNSF